MARKGHEPKMETTGPEYGDESTMAGKKRTVHRSKRGAKRTRKRNSKRY